MTWFASMLLAGAMFTSGNTFQAIEVVSDYDDTPAPRPVMLDETEKIQKTYPFNPDGRIDISNLNGSITIEAWDSPQIEFEAVKIASTKERLADVELKINASQSLFEASTEYKSWKDKNKNSSGEGDRKYSKLSVNFKLKVPRTAVLKSIQTVNGSVTVSNMTNYVEVSAVNGAVQGKNLRGRVNLSTVNGTVLADFDNISGDSTIALNTVNGTVRLDMPSGSNATVKADSLSGSIENDFGLPVRKGKYVGKDLYGRIGSGDVKIRLNNVNGGIKIARKEDGGALSPVVDLLDQKTSDDFDDTFESRFESDVLRINKDFERVLAESKAKIEISNVEVEQAVRAVESAIAAVSPEVVIDAEAIRKAAEALDREKLTRELDAERYRVEAELARASEALYMGRSPFIEEKSGSFPVSGTPSVTIDAKNCAVTVKGWDKPEVKYSVTRLKRNQDGGEVDVQTMKQGSEVELTVQGQNGASNDGEFLNKVRLEVYVPKKSNLKIITNGEVRLAGVTGDLELVGNKGSVNVRDSQGNLVINDANATVRVIGFGGSLETNGVKGDVYLEGNFKKINSEKGVGNVFLTLANGTDATITACKFDMESAVAVNEDTYKLGSLDVIRKDESTWKIGSGRSAYNFELLEGSLHLRPQSDLFIN